MQTLLPLRAQMSVWSTWTTTEPPMFSYETLNVGLQNWFRSGTPLGRQSPPALVPGLGQIQWMRLDRNMSSFPSIATCTQMITMEGLTLIFRTDLTTR